MEKTLPFTKDSAKFLADFYLNSKTIKVIGLYGLTDVFDIDDFLILFKSRTDISYCLKFSPQATTNYIKKFKDSIRLLYQKALEENPDTRYNNYNIFRN